MANFRLCATIAFIVAICADEAIVPDTVGNVTYHVPEAEYEVIDRILAQAR